MTPKTSGVSGSRRLANDAAAPLMVTAAGFRRDGNPHRILGALDRMHAQDGHVVPAAVVHLAAPGIGEPGLGVALQREYLDHAFPDGLAFEGFLDADGAEVAALDAMQVSDGLPQPLTLRHAAFSIKLHQRREECQARTRSDAHHRPRARRHPARRALALATPR